MGTGARLQTNRSQWLAGAAAEDCVSMCVLLAPAHQKPVYECHEGSSWSNGKRLVDADTTSLGLQHLTAPRCSPLSPRANSEPKRLIHEDRRDAAGSHRLADDQEVVYPARNAVSLPGP